MDKIVTIHQPDFMPWLGFFNKIHNADEFIVLDHVLNNPKTADFYCRRVKMLVGKVETWVSVNLSKDESGLFIPINAMTFNLADANQFNKLEKTIYLNYKNAPCFNEVFYLIEQYCNATSNKLIDRNMLFIKEVLQKLNIDTPLILSSELNPIHKSNVMLIDLLQKRQASEYLCGNGAASYQEDDLFNKENINVKYNTFNHPNYEQFSTDGFIKGLSIVDALMNVGFNKVEKLIKN